MKLSFLTSSMNRLHHLKQTYLKNIESSLSTNGCKVEFVLLNYNSTDGIDRWVKTELKSLPVEFKYLKTTKPTYFHMSKTKNILGKNATGNILCWLDADNITHTGFVQYVVEAYTNNLKTVLKVDWSKSNAGTCGRIVCRKEDFLKIGGYDEQMTGWGYEEIDFWKRLEKTGANVRGIPNRYLDKIMHDNVERFSNYDPGLVRKLPSDHPFFEMGNSTNYENFRLCEENLAKRTFVANSNSSWGELL